MVSSVSHETKEEEMMPLAYGELTPKQGGKNDSIDEEYEINPDDLKIQTEVLGSGHFCDVLLGFLRASDGRQITVAVKRPKMSNKATLNEEQRVQRYHEQLKSLRCETNIMSNMGTHPNVLLMLGAITKNPDDYCVVIEYCEHGSLDKFLINKEKQGKFLNEYMSRDDDGYQRTQSEICWKIQEDCDWEANFESRRKEGIVTTTDLMFFGLQIAQAMDFLTSKRILHRDMALRNVLLTGDLIAKVGDFGLSRKIVDGIYQPENASEMPIGYLAPEVLQYRQYSIKSESWTFGIVLWELFTRAGRRPYVSECGIVDEPTVSAYLGAGKRLTMPETIPISVRTLISQLWSNSPADRPGFKTSHKMITEDLRVANPQLAALARKMSKLNCGNSLSDSTTSLVPYDIVDKKVFTESQIEFRQSKGSKIVKHIRGFVAARWSWSFKASEAYNTPLESRLYGSPFVMDLGSGCATLVWKPYLIPKQSDKDKPKFLFFLEYISGPLSLRAWRSMVLVTGDGREIMQGSDFDRNGSVYSENFADDKVWATSSIYLTNTSGNDPLTLRIEVFVHSAWSGCAVEKATPNSPVNYEEECSRLPTKTKLYFNGSCYVGSNTMTKFPFAIQLCNDIPSAAVSRLAWIESEELMEKLRNVLIIHQRTGEQKNEPYWIGAKQFPENSTIRPSPDKNWYWIDSDGIQKKPFPTKYSLWTNGQPDDRLQADERYAAIFFEQRNLSDVVDSNWFRYLCEYRDRE